MSLTKLNKRLAELEKNIVYNRPRGKTRIVIEDPSERALHQKAAEINQSMMARLDELTSILKENPNANIKTEIEALQGSPEDQLIIQRSMSLVWQIIFSLFDDTIGMAIHHNDVFYKWLFNARLSWFLCDMMEWFFQRRQEDLIICEPGFLDLCEGEQQKRLAPLYANWRKDLLSEESWDRYYEKHSPKIMEPTKQELEEVNQEEKKLAKHDARILKEKCPSCKDKGSCKWYQDTILEPTSPAISSEEKH